MDLFDVVRSCARRWYVFLPILLIASGYAYNSYTSVKPVYYSNTIVSVAPPNQRITYSMAGAPIPVNGLLEAGGATLITNMAVIAFGSPEVRRRVADAGGSWSFTVKNFPGPAGVESPVPLPLMMVESTTPDEDLSKRTVEAAASQIDPVVRDLQRNAGVADEQMVRALIVAPTFVIKAMPSRTKSALGIIFGGLMLAILAAVITDVFATRRRARRKSTPVETAGSAGGHPQRRGAQPQEALSERELEAVSRGEIEDIRSTVGGV